MYLRSGLTCPAIHSAVSWDLASEATLDMCNRDVSLTYPSGVSSTGASPVVALFAYLSATSSPVAPLCAVRFTHVADRSLVARTEIDKVWADSWSLPVKLPIYYQSSIPTTNDLSAT